ncbi:hypothetical protein ABZ260_27740 [Streptosporangium sp. NPDC006013]|uniref:hypothetical protein n=1 Tax=Streptosporangium sp. NPDC006013 TaxID=3155596 RepID=UPI0033AFB470
MQFAMPPVVSAVSATASAVDQHGSLTPADEVVDMAGLRQAWAQILVIDADGAIHWP